MKILQDHSEKLFPIWFTCMFFQLQKNHALPQFDC